MRNGCGDTYNLYVPQPYCRFVTGNTGVQILSYLNDISEMDWGLGSLVYVHAKKRCEDINIALS